MTSPGGPVHGLRPYLVDIRPDPRISNERPAWLADDEQWRDQLQALDLDQIRWVERHWEMAGGAAPQVDTLWVTTENIGGAGIWPLVGAMALLSTFVVLLLDWLS